MFDKINNIYKQIKCLRVNLFLFCTGKKKTWLIEEKENPSSNPLEVGMLLFRAIITTIVFTGR